MHGCSSRALGLCLVLCAAPLTAQSGAFKAALPEHTLVYASFPDIRVSLKEMKDMPIARIWREGEVQDFLADGLKMVEAYWEQGLAEGRKMHEAGKLPFDPDDLTKLRVESFSVAMTDLELIAPKTDGGEPQPRIGLQLHASFGDSAAIWQKVIRSMIEMGLERSGGEAEMSESKVGETTVWTIAKAGEESPVTFNIAFVGDGVVVGTLTDGLAATLGNMAEGKGSFTKSPAYAAVAKNIEIQGSEAELYMQPGLFMDFVVNVLKLARDEAPGFPPWLDPDGVDRVFDALGLRAIKGIGAASTYAGDRCVTTGFIAAPSPERKGLLAGGDKELSLGFLRWVPQDAVSFSGASFEIMNVYEALTSALKAYNPEMAEQMLGHLAAMEEQVGVSVKEDLFGSFGNEIYSWSMPMAAFGTAPELAFLIKIKSEERLMKTLNTIAAMSDGNIELDKVERRGITAYQLRLNLDMGGGMTGFNPMDMFIPTFGFKNDFMVVGLSTGDVKRVFERMDREDDAEGDIRSNPEFSPYLEQLPEKGLTSLSFTDWKAQFEGFYQLVTSMLAFVPLDENIPVDLSLLPDSSTLTQHLCGSVSWSSSDGAGYRTKAIGPWGPETVALVGTCVIAGLSTVAWMQSAGGFR